MASTNSHASKVTASQTLTVDQEAEGSIQNTADMTAFVQNLVVQMQTGFQAISEGIIANIDDMGSKIDALEKSINDLKSEIDPDSTGMPNHEAKSSDESS